MAKCNQCLFGYCHNCSGCDCVHGKMEHDSINGTEESSEQEETNWRSRGAGVRRFKREAAIKDAESTGHDPH